MDRMDGILDSGWRRNDENEIAGGQCGTMMPACRLLTILDLRAHTHRMNDQQLERNLHLVGRACFVNYFDEFTNPMLTTAQVAAMLTEREGYTPNAGRTRASRARRIINAGRAADALLDISRSYRVPPRIARRAGALARELAASAAILKLQRQSLPSGDGIRPGR